MGTGLYSTVCCHGDHIDLAILCREQYDNAFAKLILELVAQVSQAIHIHTVYAGCQKLCSLDFHCLIHDIAQCGLCHLGFQGFVLSIQSLQFCLHMLDLLGQGCRSCLCGCGCLIEVLFHSLIVCHHVGTGQCFDSSDAGSDTALGQDLEVTDLTGMLYMSTTTQFLGEVSHGYHADSIAVFFSEQSHSSALLRILDAHDIGNNCNILCDLLVDQSLYFSDLFCSHSLSVAEVKTGSCAVLVRTLLFYMITQYDLQCLL